MNEKNPAWYIGRRGELLAEQFLLDLEPKQVLHMEGPDFSFDFMAFFTNAQGAQVATAIEVKATEREIKDRYVISASVASRLLNYSNLPVLIIAVNVKTNEIFFNWIKQAIPEESLELLGKRNTCTIFLRKATNEEKEKLKKEILNL